MRTGMAVVVFAAACATPYQSMAFRGGYSESLVGAETYAVHVKVNGFTSAGTALEYAYRRAGEVCPQGFDVLDGSRSAQYSAYVTSYGANVVTKPEVTMIVQCKAAVATRLPERMPEPPPAASPADRRIITGTAPIYCTTSPSDPTMGACFLDETACQSMQAKLSNETTHYNDCAAVVAASCFNADEVLTSKHDTICAPSITNCESTLASFRTNADFTVSATMRCGIYRQQAPATPATSDAR